MQRAHRRTRSAVALIAAVVSVLALVAPAAAGAPKSVTIVSHVTFNPDGPNFGDFDASGAAVDSVVCPAGTFVDTFIHFAGFQSDRGVVQLQVDKTFTCDDGSGSFFVKLQIQANFDTGLETFTWVANGGTGVYTGLRGSGRGTTVPNAPIGNINTYEGFLLR
jgi:hypothetical protein